jgi:hypothetical protein
MAGLIEQRKHPRAPVDYQYFLYSQDGTLSGAIRDLSPYGTGLFSPSGISPEKMVDLRIFLPDALQIDAKGEIVFCVANPDPAANPAKYLIGLKFMEGPMQDFASAAGVERSRYTPSHTVVINAEAKICYELLSCYTRYPEWASGVKRAQVLETYPDGRGKRVEFLHDFFFRKIRYVLNYTYHDEKNILSWVSAGADQEIVSIAGSYTFKSVVKDSTYATYALDVTLSIIPSSRLVQYVTNILMRKEMKNFKSFVEQQALKPPDRPRP